MLLDTLRHTGGPHDEARCGPEWQQCQVENPRPGPGYLIKKGESQPPASTPLRLPRRVSGQSEPPHKTSPLIAVVQQAQITGGGWRARSWDNEGSRYNDRAGSGSGGQGRGQGLRTEATGNVEGTKPCWSGSVPGGRRVPCLPQVPLTVGGGGGPRKTPTGWAVAPPPPAATSLATAHHTVWHPGQACVRCHRDGPGRAHACCVAGSTCGRRCPRSRPHGPLLTSNRGL